MAKRQKNRQHNGQKIKYKQRSIKHTHKTKELSLICSNIPAAPAYGVYISQLIRYSRACGSYQDFLERGLMLTRKIQNQGFLFHVFRLLTDFVCLYTYELWLSLCKIVRSSVILLLPLLVKLKSSLQKLYGRHHDLVDRYGIYVSQMTTDMFHLS